VARFHKLPQDHGILIAEIEPRSPAALSGLREGDIIVGFKGQPVRTIDDLHRRLTFREIGVASPLMLLRGTEKIFATVIPRELQAAAR